MDMSHDLSSLEKAWSGGSSDGKTNPSIENVDSANHNDDMLPEGRSDNGYSRTGRSMMLSPIHEVPTRHRLDTAETDQIRNFVRSDAAAAPPAPPRLLTRQQEEDDTQRDDVSSIVSSLSKDDSYHPRPELAAATGIQEECVVASPPTEVSFPAAVNKKEEETAPSPEWLKMEPTTTVVRPFLQREYSLPTRTLRPTLRRDNSAPPDMMMNTPKRAPSVRTLLSTPNITRPTLGRNHSSPPMDFSIASSSVLTSNSSMVDSATGSSMDALVRNGSSDSRLLGERKKRCHHRSQSNPNSVGSIAGQSSFATAPTVSSSYTGSEGSSVRRNKSAMEASRMLSAYTGADDGAACCSINAEEAFRKRNVVKEELKYMIDVMSTPIRRLKKTNIDLKRSGGCLT